VFSAYYIPVEFAFVAIEMYREVFLRRYHSKDPSEFKINAPCEFRFVTIGKQGPVLFDIPPGEYIVADLIAYTGLPKGMIYEAFRELEELWLALGAYPHLSKVFGFHETAPGVTKAFNREHFTKTSSEEGRRLFRQRQLAADPHGIFFTPHASWFLDEVSTSSCTPCEEV
jgi:hypothetical protein